LNNHQHGPTQYIRSRTVTPSEWTSHQNWRGWNEPRVGNRTRKPARSDSGWRDNI